MSERTAIRKGFASRLAAAAVPTIANAVYDHFVGNFEHRTGVIVVQSGPVIRQVSDVGASCWRTEVELYVHTFSPYAEPDSGWTEADAEDKLDELEATVAAVVLANTYADGLWGNLEYNESGTEPGSIEIGGKAYRSEVIRLRAEVLE